MSASNVTLDFPSEEFRSLSRRDYRKLLDTPAVIKMAALLIHDREMAIHTAARIASRYTTGSCPDSTARRLKKRLNTVAFASFTRGRLEIDLSSQDYDILLELIQLTESYVDNEFLPFMKVSEPYRQRLFARSLPFLYAFYLKNMVLILDVIRPDLIT
jgi:hypothetical protein